MNEIKTVIIFYRGKLDLVFGEKSRGLYFTVSMKDKLNIKLLDKVMKVAKRALDQDK